MQCSLECGVCCFIIIKCLVGFQEYFGYNILYVMNVTDVDDKIINRARRNYLLDHFRATATDPDQVILEFSIC
jgi:cysteinyl-tRNA synthetase